MIASRLGEAIIKKDGATMNIKTLEFIHQILLAEKDKRENAYTAASDLENQYEESETANEELIRRQKETVDELMKEYFAVLGVLINFEEQEW